VTTDKTFYDLPFEQEAVAAPVTSSYFQMFFLIAFLQEAILEIIIMGYSYLLTPWCRVLLEKLTGLQLVKKFPAFHGT